MPGKGGNWRSICPAIEVIRKEFTIKINCFDSPPIKKFVPFNKLLSWMDCWICILISCVTCFTAGVIVVTVLWCLDCFGLWTCVCQDDWLCCTMGGRGPCELTRTARAYRRERKRIQNKKFPEDPNTGHLPWTIVNKLRTLRKCRRFETLRDLFEDVVRIHADKNYIPMECLDDDIRMMRGRLPEEFLRGFTDLYKKHKTLMNDPYAHTHGHSPFDTSLSNMYRVIVRMDRDIVQHTPEGDDMLASIDVSMELTVV